MFLLIPLLVIFISILAIGFIIWRKRPYLKQMIATGGNSSDFNLNSNFSFLEYGGEFFPELSRLFNKMIINKYKGIGLMEVEKSLRKMRLFFLKIDRLSYSLIRKIRRVHLNDQLGVHMAEDNSNKDVYSSATAPALDENKEISGKKISPVFLKNEEQRLIIEIAKNPKDPHLYEMLGDLYIEMDNFTDAKESYEASIELNPQNPALKEKLSGVLEKLNLANL